MLSVAVFFSSYNFRLRSPYFFSVALQAINTSKNVGFQTAVNADFTFGSV